SNPNVAKHFGTGSNQYIIIDIWVSFMVFFTRSTKCYTLVDCHVVTNVTSFTDDNTHTVIDKQSAPNIRSRMYFYTCQKTHYLGNDAGDEFEIFFIKPVRD